MATPRSRWAFVAPLAIAVAFASSAHAATATPAGTDPALRIGGPSIAAGSHVEVTFDPRVIPADVDELELLISLDGGRTYPLRITPSAGASTLAGRLAFRVPVVPSRTARLALRGGSRRHEERILAASACFEIASDPAPALEILHVSGGELATREALEREDDGLPDGVRPAGPDLTQLGETSDLDGSPDPARLEPPRLASRAPGRAPERHLTLPPPPVALASFSLPMRE